MNDVKPILAVALLAAMLATPHAARAVVENSPHDLLGQRYILRGEGEAPVQCVECHLPVFAGDQFAMDKAPPSVSLYGRTGLLCYSCHDGTTIVNENVDASGGAFHPDSHPLLMGNMPPPRYETGQVELPVTVERLECTTCHTPHDSSIRPFLRIGVVQLCTVCHTGRENKGYGPKNVSGGHPVHETIEDDAGLKSPVVIPAPLRVAFPQNYPLDGGKMTPNVHWTRGGHLSAGGEGTIECPTCHAVHGDEGSFPRANLTAVDPVRETSDKLCEGCHQGVRGDGRESSLFPNPGGTVTGRTYHPCDDDQSNGSNPPVGIRLKISWPLGTAESRPIICTTCHVPHGGMPGTPALRKPVEAASYCEECHLAASISPFHHPLIPGLDSGYDCLVPPQNFLSSPGSKTLSCYACHVAHNAGLGKKEADHIPLLRFSILDDQFCLQCHGDDNITCLEPNRGKASHFLGDPTLSTTYNDQAPPLRDTVWPQTQLMSRYGGEREKTVICLSCHVFRSSPALSLSQPMAHYTLAASGNAVEWELDPGVYLCTGCHGVTPSSSEIKGHTHPLLNADVSKLTQLPQLPATVTVNKHVNCDSCHQAHATDVRGGYYILDKLAGPNTDPKVVHPMIDFTPLCQLCHDKY